MTSKAKKRPAKPDSVPFDSRSTAAKLQRIVDAFRGELPLQERRNAGKALRETLPREVHGDWRRDNSHPGAVEIVMQTNAGRQPELIPLRMARMAASPFSFYRGAAAVMAHDLARTPITGIPVVMDGDAHINNFGLYGSPQRDVVFDLNDFDEAVLGPWEWDLKRLAASVNLAGRENGMNQRELDVAVHYGVRGYRENMQRLSSMGVLETWYLHAYPGRDNPLMKFDQKSKAVVAKAVEKAASQTNSTLLSKVADKDKTGRWSFRDDPPVLTRVDAATRNAVISALEDYAPTLSRERQFMLTRYQVADVAHRVVGVGSVGTRAYLVLLFGNGDQDPLFLQVKEAIIPAHAPFLPKPLEEFKYQGKRVVAGQHAIQSSSDVMLGWTQIGSCPFYVRQMKNMKASIPIEWLSGTTFNLYAWSCGAILARAHARTSDAAHIAGYCGRSSALDQSLARWADAYAMQTIQDHAALVKAVKNDRKVQAMIGK
jgi:uncharacterized protein (DUF2252 family)